MYRLLIRPVFFLFPPETIHHFVFSVLKVAFKVPGLKSITSFFYERNSQSTERKLFGLTFKNPVGLAAGFDKDARLYNELGAFGFGFIEIGTLTPLPQPGNEKPRMFRLKKDSALINRMGFNNEGALAAAERIRANGKNIILGVNIGKNKITSNEDAMADYDKCFRALYVVADYFVVNVSSPNTPGLRALQDKEPLLRLLLHLKKLNVELGNPKAILLKIAPDLTNEQLDEIAEVVITSKCEGVIATNTTISRENLETEKNVVEQAGMGGLSGKPLTKRSTEVIRYLKGKSNNQFKIIGVGGIHSPQDAIEKLNAGADLIQLYTGFIYEGPGLIKKINKALHNQSQN